MLTLERWSQWSLWDVSVPDPKWASVLSLWTFQGQRSGLHPSDWGPQRMSSRCLLWQSST